MAVINVAMDGPVGAGKSSVAREAAKRLGFIYVDTGALYRSCGLYCCRNDIDIIHENDELIGSILNEKVKLEIRLVDGVQHVILNGEDVSEEMSDKALCKKPVWRQAQFPHSPPLDATFSIHSARLPQKTMLLWTEEISELLYCPMHRLKYSLPLNPK